MRSHEALFGHSHAQEFAGLANLGLKQVAMLLHWQLHDLSSKAKTPVQVVLALFWHSQAQVAWFLTCSLLQGGLLRHPQAQFLKGSNALGAMQVGSAGQSQVQVLAFHVEVPGHLRTSSQTQLQLLSNLILGLVQAGPGQTHFPFGPVGVFGAVQADDIFEIIMKLMKAILTSL